MHVPFSTIRICVQRLTCKCVQAYTEGAVLSLTGLLADPNKSVVLYAVRCMGNLAEMKREVMLTPDDDVYRATFERAMP
jgi:hypothetical protein